MDEASDRNKKKTFGKLQEKSAADVYASQTCRPVFAKS